MTEEMTEKKVEEKTEDPFRVTTHPDGSISISVNNGENLSREELLEKYGQAAVDKMIELEAAVAKFDLNKLTAELLNNEPFFAAFSRNINKAPTLSIPTAGVMFDRERLCFQMVYNPIWMSGLTKTEMLGVMKHEFYHVIFGHLTSRLLVSMDKNDHSLEAQKAKQVANIAYDLAINSYLANEIPKTLLLPGRKEFADYPLCETSEWYFAKLKEDKEFQEKMDKMFQECDGSCTPGGSGTPCNGGSKCKGNLGQFDDHEGFGGNDDISDVIKEKAKALSRKSARIAEGGTGWGTVPESIREELRKLLKSTLDWKGILRSFIKQSQRTDRRGSVRRINKRYPYIHPGKKFNRLANIAISIDQSGSVSDHLLARFFGELNGLAKLATFTVIPFDASVEEKDVYIWKKGQNRDVVREKCGGTDFNAPTLYVNDRKEFDGHIILTDLEAPKPVRSLCKRMWITSESHYNRSRGDSYGFDPSPQEIVAVISDD